MPVSKIGGLQQGLQYLEHTTTLTILPIYLLTYPSLTHIYPFNGAKGDAHPAIPMSMWTLKPVCICLRATLPSEYETPVSWLKLHRNMENPREACPESGNPQHGFLTHAGARLFPHLLLTMLEVSLSAGCLLWAWNRPGKLFVKLL